MAEAGLEDCAARLIFCYIDAKIYFAQLYLDNEMNFQPFFLHLDLVCGGYATNYVSLFGFTIIV
ncbi:hypothetical protein BLOT_014397 [Blomia tropicalis]|nr:hypothetical protein BLOT_014397 [Blomia tropicalis]